jgi:hypothetical protein
LRENLDGAVRHIAGDAPKGKPPGFELSAVPKKDALNFPKDEKTAGDFVQDENPVQLGRVTSAYWCCALAVARAAAAWRLASIAAKRARVNSWDCRCVSARRMSA